MKKQELIKMDKKSDQQSIDLKQLIAGTYIIRTTDTKTHKSQSQQFIVE